MSSSPNHAASSKRNHPVIGTAAGLTTLVSLAVLFLATSEWPPRLDPAPHEAAGWGLAQLALSRLSPGGQITVIVRDTSEFKQPAIDILFRRFKSAIRKGHASIRTVHAIEADPLRLVEVPSGDFMTLLHRAPPGSVVVSFLGPPMLTSQQREQLGEIKAKVVAFCPGNAPAQIDLRQLFAARLLDAAVISRRSPAPGAARARSEAARFDQLYQTVSATNVASLYASAHVEL
jgi:hypothetical protein